MTNNDKLFLTMPSWRDLIPGASQACASIASGYPFDTMKIRLQTGHCTTFYSCMVKTIQNEGIAGFYRGVSMPLLVTVPKRAVQFYLLEDLRKTHNNFVAAGIAGLACSVFNTPMNKVKISMQNSHGAYKNSWGFIRSLYMEQGIHGFYRGFRVQCLRTVSFATVNLGTYTTLREYMPHTKSAHFATGAIASVSAYTILFPIDYAKTTVMASRNNVPVPIIQCVITKAQTDGVLSLWRGITPVLLRVAPVGGTSMVAYECARAICQVC